MASDYTPQRIVSLQPSATVILQEIGKLDCVVACTRYCAEVCPEVKNGGRAIIADSWTAHADEITAAAPDLVIAAVPYREKAVAEILKSGARFLGLAPKTLNDIYGDIAAIAGMMGASGEGQKVIERMQSEIEAVRSRVNGCSRLRVFCEEWGKPVIASQKWVAELVEAAGGSFLGNPGTQQNIETIREEDPEVVIAAWCGAGNRVPLRKIVRDRKWETTLAAQRSRIYCVNDEFLNTPAPTLIHGLRALAAAIHPEIFPQPAQGLRCIAAES